MGYWLWKYFKSKGGLANPILGTEVFNLPRQGIISNLLIELQATSGTTNQGLFLQNAISKIEVIGNGSTVIVSLTGQQLQASMAYDDHAMSPDKELGRSGTCWGYFDVRFGRYVGDLLYALDCSKWNSLELKITYDLNATGAQATTGFASGTGYLSIYGLYSPDGAGLAPVGYLKKAQKKTYTTVADAEKDLELPTDYPFRRLLLVLTSVALVVPYNAFQYVTVNINDGARKPIDNMLGNDLMIFDLAMRGNPIWLHSKRYYLAQGGNNVPTRMGWIRTASCAGISHEAVITNVHLAWIEMAAAAISEAHINAFGYCPDKALCIDLEKWSGGKHGVEAMMDTLGFDQSADIHFLHTQQTADLSTQVVLEQYATPPA